MLVSPLRACHLRLTDQRWEFETEHAAKIAAHWQKALADTPSMWDGRILLTCDWAIEDGVVTGRCADVAYSSYLAWRSWGFPDTSVVNCFGSAIIASNDGAILYGVMGSSTANAGRIYPVAGTLDHSDVAGDGSIDIFGSIARELREETGIGVEECRRGARIAVREGQIVSIAELLHFDASADALAGRIRAGIEADPNPELDDVVVIRKPSDVDMDRSFRFARRIAEEFLS